VCGLCERCVVCGMIGRPGRRTLHNAEGHLRETAVGGAGMADNVTTRTLRQLHFHTLHLGGDAKVEVQTNNRL
jgi:hypothetical protein